MKCHRVGLVTRLINYFLKETNLMATIQEVEQQVSDLTASLQAVDTKLDEIKTFIQGLQQGGQLVTQEQLDALSAKIEAAKGVAAANLAEADALDG